MTAAPTILIVDDELKNRKLLAVLLHAEGYLTTSVDSGVDALASIAASAPDLILLDNLMPGMDGCQVAIALKADPATSGIPIIMLTARVDREARLAGLDAGAEDFLSKPVDRAELWLRVRNLLRLKMLGDFHRRHSVVLEEEVRERTADLHHLAHFDSLTGLPNRVLFHEMLRKALPHAAAQELVVAVVFVDVDDFKAVNDTLGRDAGDEVLVQLSERLVRCIRVRDVVGRFGGDEFALMLTMESGDERPAAVAQKILEAVRAPFDVTGHDVVVTASIGITLYPHDASDPDTLVRYADTAMYRAKHAGRDTFQFFTPQMNADVVAQVELDVALRKAVVRNEFVLHYQPKADLSTGRISGVEALLRWSRPGAGLVPPGAFIPALESTGRIVRVGAWVIDAACEQIARWRRSSVVPVPVAVNVSARQLVDGDLYGTVVRALADHEVPADLLELELTESALMVDTERTVATLRELRDRGVRISVDDFGTGYSSLAYLRSFPIDTLKIDGTFIQHITTSADDAAIALAIIRMAHSLNLEVVAECVETAGQLAYLRHHRCDQIQGFFFSRPLAPDGMEQLLREAAHLPAQDGVEPSTFETILFVDDDPVVAASARRLVDDAYRVLTATSIAQAFELLAVNHVHVVACSQQMPDMSGIEFLEQVMELHPNTLRIILSADPDSATIIRAINGGSIFRYYSKPWDDDALRAGLRDALRRYWRNSEDANLQWRL